MFGGDGYRQSRYAHRIAAMALPYAATAVSISLWSIRNGFFFMTHRRPSLSFLLSNDMIPHRIDV